MPGEVGRCRYGQSGSGKSYSVVGYNPNIGIVPRCCSNLFEIINQNTDPNVKFQVDIAMVEIYMVCTTPKKPGC